ncbi:MAG: hypothetical protein ACYCY6_02245 [Minisyncoccota bacterium]
MAKLQDKDLSTDAKIWMVLLTIIIAFTVIILYARDVNLSRIEDQANVLLVARYTNYAYGVNLQFPSGWQPSRGYDYERYEGEGGFFGLMAGGTGDISIDEMVENETSPSSNGKPYGTSPIVRTLTIDGQEARVIIPDIDQDPNIASQAVLIVRYPVPIEFDSATYKYLIFMADKEHIEVMANSISFIR